MAPPQGHGHGHDDSPLPYKRQDALGAGVQSGLVMGGAGLFLSAVRTSLEKTHVGPWAVFTKHGGIVATFAAVGTAYEFTRVAAANLREKEDHYNNAIGGFVGGAVLGLRTGRIPRIIGYGLVTSLALAVFEYTGGRIEGRRRDPEADEFERKEKLRLMRRRPLEETIAEIGEGRGIRPPGYEERRRERLKEKYGIDINPVSADPDRA
ncbi:Tim17/Tim22/Tim23/Pmp24 family-domain-containing protein [Podospora australis]|uniref:Tim17/Tim22/Tim23/Pmp24 family-domain-containing protein n=1 Tax=Podospora australis TaxID=1536484 RepID=A0AAN7AMM4_9PEZI|nr:Tim17/Tim22/Tim23/Pmp24 family-domain-containing protein [Podospora australis]